ncbi:MAG: hypothetical protein L0Y67_02895 [Gammaproteobacteria bacterium]|nr:hypothetical protein [Gammaproteobacteria bacterium]MCI0590542.1 hypothetical protein [Gammaproteobacteria bacterium]
MTTSCQGIEIYTISELRQAMSSHQSANRELPAEVIDLLQAGRKVQAIKLLRSARGVDLVDAKQEVDAFIRENEYIYRSNRPLSDSAEGLLFLIILIALILAAYSYFS